ncbi:MAG TPA: FAD-dependent thymidylate synthase [Dehalococcoidia bacterium]|nr:FAD-dependent thymidylate synthase [Dehalococcoidia bacterium]
MSTSDTGLAGLRRRVYPLDARKLSEEQIAVAFAMTSRRPEPFDEIAQQVSQEKAADFHERWVLGYGHASVAEHAVVHLAVENISRLACDTLEDNRLGSYTEKSSRYQVLPEGGYYFPTELEAQPDLSEEYRRVCDHLFRSYLQLIEACTAHLRQVHPRRQKERETTYNLRLSRIATDHCRAVLPSATLTNVGVTANARMLEHAISKLLSSELAEERGLGVEIRNQGREITPTLIKYAEENPYLRMTPRRQQELSVEVLTPEVASAGGGSTGQVSARLLDWDNQAEARLATALLYPKSGMAYEMVQQQVSAMDSVRRQSIIDRCTEGLGPHDAPGREFELVNYTFEFMMDYGAYREFKRHRMLSYIPQALTVSHGHSTPEVIAEAGLTEVYQGAMELVDRGSQSIAEFSPLVAQYLVTHAHYRRVLVQMNLRECYHLFKLRTSELAHFAIREPILEAMKLVVAVQPQLFRHLRLRDYPAWWPFPH